jgi:hypothetical protein
MLTFSTTVLPGVGVNASSRGALPQPLVDLRQVAPASSTGRIRRPPLRSAYRRLVSAPDLENPTLPSVASAARCARSRSVIAARSF